MSKKFYPIKGFFIILLAALLNLILTSVTMAASVIYPSMGQASHNILQPVSLFTEGFFKLCYIVAGMFLMGAVVQYKNHRDTPSAVRLSTPVVLFLLGLAFVLLPLISKVSPSASAALGY